MKKLVIAAAIAAMIGGVQAAGYDFTASVKTTKAKYGTQKTTYTVNLGKDDNGTFWWDDLGWDNEKEAKNAVKKMTNEEKAEFAILSCGFDGVKTDYNEQEAYKNKKTWCYTFKFTETVENCYRVAGSAKLTGKVTMDACCGTWEFVEYNFGKTELDNDEDGVSAINAGLIYRIGGVSLNKADKVEVTGTMGADAYDGMVPGTFAYAGQGAFDVKNGYIKNISGNIVGVLDNPDCETCCDYDSPAIVFACDGSEDSISLLLDDENDIFGTAAFGTFSLKYNKKY